MAGTEISQELFLQLSKPTISRGTEMVELPALLDILLKLTYKSIIPEWVLLR